MDEWTKEEKDVLISKEIKRLKKIFKDLSKGEKAAISGLIQEAAFMRVSLDEMKMDLNENGYTEEFTQGIGEMAPRYDRERPIARLYATMNKNYQTIMKQLFDFVPRKLQKEKTDQGDGFDEFVNNR